MLFDLKTLIHSTEQNYSQIKGLAAAYELLLGGIPNIEGFAALIKTNNKTNFGSKTAIGAGPVFNDETIIINSMNALYQGNAGAKAAFDAIAVGPTLAVKIAAVYDTLIPITHQTINGRIYFADQATFYSAKAAELGIPGEEGAALVAAAALTKIAIDNDIPGFGDGINDLIDSINDGSSAIPNAGTVLTQVETADGAVFDQDQSQSLGSTLINITEEGNNSSDDSSISSNGRHIAFSSDASNLTVSDTNGVEDIFVYDVQTAEIVNITSHANGASEQPDISDGGYLMAFTSAASNLTENDTNGNEDVFFYDARTNKFLNLTEGLNNLAEGVKTNYSAPSISNDGTKVVFYELTSDRADVYFYDALTGIVTNITADANGHINALAAISGSGDHIVFSSNASNLTPNDSNKSTDIFVYNITEGTFTNQTNIPNIFEDYFFEFEIKSKNFTNPSISDDGNFIEFESILRINTLEYDFGFIDFKYQVYQRGLIVEELYESFRPIETFGDAGDVVYIAVFGGGYQSLLDSGSENGVIVFSNYKNVYGNNDSFAASPSADASVVSFSSDATNLSENDTNGRRDIFLWRGELVNQAPTVRLSPHVNSIVDTTNASTGLAMAAITITDDGVGVNNLSLHGDDANLFTISGTGQQTELRLKPGASLDGSVSPWLDVTVRVNDPAFGVSYNDATTFAIPVLTPSLTPALGVLTSSLVKSVSEDADTSSRILVGSGSVHDFQLGEYEFYLSGEDSNLFEIIREGADPLTRDDTLFEEWSLYLKAGASLDFETNSSLDLVVNINDPLIGATPDDSAIISIAVIDVDDEPTIDFGFSKIINVTTAGNGASRTASVDANGTKVAFASDATNLAGIDSNGVTDIIIYNVATAAFTNVTAAADLASKNPSMSSNGSKVAFTSTASNLTPGDADGGLEDIFIYDLASATFTNVSGGSSLFSDNASWSADGGTLVFNGFVGSVDQIFTYDVVSAALTILTATGNGASFGASASTNGNKIAFSSNATNLTANDVNGQVDIIVYDKSGATFSNITAAGNGGSGEASISADGSKVVFTSGANNLTANDTNAANDIFLYNASTASITNITAFGNMDSSNASISADGSKITFSSFANNLTKNDINGELDVFLYDVATGTISNISALSNRPSTGSTISSNGGHAAFSSNAANLTVNDINGQQDIFFYEFA